MITAATRWSRAVRGARGRSSCSSSRCCRASTSMASIRSGPSLSISSPNAPSGGWLQSSPVIPELGFCLGTRQQISWLDEAAASSLAPGKRPRSTLSPTLALKDGEPAMAFGTPGGDGQDQWSAQLLLHHLHHGMNLQEAIDCPEFNNAHAPSSFYPRAADPGALVLEGRFPEKTLHTLAERGHRVRFGETWSGGRLTACAREETPEGTVLHARANPPGVQTYAVGR